MAKKEDEVKYVKKRMSMEEGAERDIMLSG